MSYCFTKQNKRYVASKHIFQMSVCVGTNLLGKTHISMYDILMANMKYVNFDSLY